MPPVRVAERSRRAPPAPAREFPVVLEDEHLIADRQAGRRGGARRQRRQLRRDRAAAPGAAAGAVPGTGAPARQGDLGPAADRQEALGADRAAGPVPRSGETGKTYAALVDRRLAGEPQGDRRAAAQVPRPPRASAACARSTPTTTTAGARSRWCKVAQTLRGLHAARRDDQDRPHAPDPRAPGARGPPDRRRRRSTATSRSTRRSRAARPCRLRFDRMFLHARRLRFEHPATRRGDRARGAAAGRMRGLAPGARPLHHDPTPPAST